MSSGVNKWVESVLSDFLEAISKDCRYFVVGSVALISYTAKSGYERLIKDIDIICEEDNFSEVASKLVRKGYKQGTFIDKKFPFFTEKLSNTKYYRFEKDGKNLEIMTSRFVTLNGRLKIKVYPGFSFSLPVESIILTQLNNTKFRAVSPETLYTIAKFLFNTWMKLVKTKIEQRKNDIIQLEKIIDREKLDFISNNAYLYFWKIKFKVPKFLIT